MGQLLGIAVATKEVEGQDVSGKARAIADAVSGAGLMAAPGEVAQRSPLVLVVLGSDAADEGSDAILVVEDGKPVGVLTRADLLGFLAD